MFDFGIDKMIVVAVLVGLVMGPERLRDLRRSLPQYVGRIHALYQQGRTQVVDELNELAPDWREYDPRQLHPRRILQDLNAAAAASTAPEVSSAGGEGESRHRPDGADRADEWAAVPTSAAGTQTIHDDEVTPSGVRVSDPPGAPTSGEGDAADPKSTGDEEGKASDVFRTDPHAMQAPRVIDARGGDGSADGREG